MVMTSLIVTKVTTGIWFIPYLDMTRSLHKFYPSHLFSVPYSLSKAQINSVCGFKVLLCDSLLAFFKCPVIPLNRTVL